MANRKFGKKQGPRKSFLKILAHNLIMKEKINTTEARAKEIRPIVERLITYGKKQNLTSLRLLLSKIPEKSANKIYYELAGRYKERNGGYLRITKTSSQRKRDGAKMSVIQFV